MGEILKRGAGFWPVDKLVLAYFAFMAVMLLAWRGSVPHAGWLLAWHVSGAALLEFLARSPA